MTKPKSAQHDFSPPPEQARFVETLFKNLPGMAYRCENDRPWTMTFVSSGCEELTGYKPEIVIGTRFGWATLIHEDDREMARITVDSALIAGEPFSIQYRIVDRFGSHKWVREQGCGIYADNGKIDAIEGFIDDITSLRSAILQLATTEAYYEEELRQQHERLKVTFENAPLGIVTYHLGGTFLSANRAFCEMVGYSMAELSKMTVLDLTHPDDHSDSVAFAHKVRQGELDTYSQCKRYIRKDGSVINISVVNATTHDVEGRPDMVIGQITDITDQIKTQTEIRRQREQLAHVDRLHTLGEMATGIAHEINQPLTAISLFSQTGRRLAESGDYDRLQEVFDKLSQHSRRAGAIVERIQDMARRQESAKQIVSLNALLEDVVELAEIDARASDIAIYLDLASELPDVRVDVIQIQQVILNLLRNGMDAMRAIDCRNGNTIQVRTRKHQSGFLEVAIDDSGTGVSDDVAERLFESFSTTKKTGLGVGLPISKAIVAAHGGDLAFRNNDTNGATFLFTLPAAGGA